MCAKLLIAIAFTAATASMSFAICGAPVLPGYSDFPEGLNLEMSEIEKLARQSSGDTRSLLRVEGGCRHFAMSMSIGSGIGSWEVVLYSGSENYPTLERELHAITRYPVGRLEMKDGIFRALSSDRKKEALSFKLRGCPP